MQVFHQFNRRYQAKMKICIVIIQFLLFLSAPEVYAGILSGLINALIEEPPKPEDYSNVQCERTCYRSFNGSCNNLKNPSWGAAGTLFARLFDSDSNRDGNCEMPHLPNPRKISLNFVDNPYAVDPIWTLCTPQFGQFLAHDITLSSGGPQSGAQAIKCPCVNGKLKKWHSVNKKCAPIKIPKWDPYNTPDYVQCYDFVRTRSTCDVNTEIPAQQYNAVTSFIDCSPVYGNSEKLAKKLRRFKHGMLDYVMIDGRMYPPQAKDPRTCNTAGTSRPLCIVTGDFRANQNPHVALMQIIFLRNHNKMAKALSKINPHWSDERCYQEARRNNIAVLQHVTYEEYLPIVLGQEYMIARGITKPDILGLESHGYDPEVNPSALNEHSTAAGRVFHTTIENLFDLLDEKGKSHGTIALSDTFNNVSLLRHCDTEAQLAIGACTQQQMAMDRFFSKSIRELMFQKDGRGEDLLAIDIFRGRDHELVNYSTALKKLRILSNVKCFDDYLKVMPPGNVKILKKLYKSPDDVDLLVGGILEYLLPGALTGITFNHIMKDQFFNLKTGDYYFHTHKQKCSYSRDQLKEIKKQSLASLICHNVGGIPIQPKAFEVPSSYNKVGPCSDLPYIDLTKWAESKEESKCCSGDLFDKEDFRII